MFDLPKLKSNISPLSQLFFHSPVNPDHMGQDENESDVFEREIIPKLKCIIKDDKKSLFNEVVENTRKAFEEYFDLGEHLIKTEILTTLVQSIKTGSQRKVLDLTQLTEEMCSAIPFDYRDDFVIEFISKYHNDVDPKLRFLSVRLLQIVRDSTRILPFCDYMANDELSNIRAAFILCLPNISSSDIAIDDVIKNAVNDDNICVQQAAASVFGSVAPHLVDEYCTLLVNQNTVRDAFPSFPMIAKANGFGSLFDAFMTAMKIDKNDAAVALLETVKVIDFQADEYLLIQAARELLTFTPFTWRLHQFSENFVHKLDFVELLNPTKLNDWRTRFALLKQCEEFVKELGCALCRVAEMFSEDSVAVIRTESVNLWIELLKHSNCIRDTMVERLTRGSWQKRIVLIKVLSNVSRQGFDHAIEALKNDEVEIVRRFAIDSLI